MNKFYTILAIVLLGFLSACTNTGTQATQTPFIITATSIPTSLTPSLVPTNTDTPQPPTPTQESQDWFNDFPINANFWMKDGCSIVKIGLREFCEPFGWDVGVLSGTAPDAKLVTNATKPYLELRIESLLGTTCLAQFETLFDKDNQNRFVNYVFKSSTSLHNIKDYTGALIVSLSLEVYTDGGDFLADERGLTQDYQENLWVIDPVETVGAHYQFCVHFHGGLQKLDPTKEVTMRIYDLSVFEAGDFWGNDVEVPIG